MKNEKILFLGDVYLNGVYKIPQENCPVIFNLEAPLTNRNTPIEGKINLKSSGNFLKGTFKKLPMAVSLANNHIMDYGNDAFIDTIKFLEESNIKYFGAGDINNNYNNPLITTIDKFKIGFLGYCYEKFYDQISNVKGLQYGPAPLNFELIEKNVISLKNRADKIIIQLHWGIEHCNYPTIEQIELARKIADLGVDLIIGHHAHTVQPVEQYKTTVIAYGLGNFIFPDLNTVSYFDSSNNTFKKYKLKQRSWNKCSAGLIYNLETYQYQLKEYYFDKNSVKHKKTYYHRYLKAINLKKFKKKPSLINKNLKLKNIQRRFFEFVENPRIPNMIGIKDTAKLFFK